MASPGLSELLSTTLSNYGDEIIDNVANKIAFLAYLKKNGHIRKVPGGNNLVETLEYAENGTYTRMSGWQEFDISPSDVITATTQDWKQIVISVALSGLEKLKNSGSKTQLHNLLKAKIRNAETSFENNFDTDLHSDGTADGGLQVCGLAAAVPTTINSGVYGGIDRATWEFWQVNKRAAQADGSAALSKDTIASNMDALYLKMDAKKHRPKVIFADTVSFGYFESAIHPLQRITDTELGNMGFTAYKYKGIPVIHDPSAPASTMYFLDPKYFYLDVHQDRDLVELEGDRTPLRQDGIIKPMGWAGNMMLTNAKAQGILVA